MPRIKKKIRPVTTPVAAPAPAPNPVSLYPPDVIFTQVTPLPMAMPAYRVPTEELSYGTLPDNKVLEYIRITDETAMGKTNPRHHYSKTQPWNHDETRAMVSGFLLDATDNYSIIHQVDGLSTNFEWSKTNNDKIYSVHDLYVKIITPSNNTQVHVYDGRANGWTSMSKGENEGTMDHQERFIPIRGVQNGVMQIGYYNVVTNTMHTKPQTFFLPVGGDIDYCTITASGGHLFVRAKTNTTTGDVPNPQAGIYTIPDLNFVRNIVLSTASHADWGFHMDGGEVLVQHNGIGFRRIETGTFRSTITNWNAQFNNGFPMAGHANARNYKLAGWMGSSNTRHDGFRECYMMKLDNGIDETCIVRRFGFARIDIPFLYGGSSYDVEVKAVCSPTGKMMMFNTNWAGQSKVYAFVSRVRLRS